MKRILRKNIYVSVFLVVLLGLMPLSIMAEETITENNEFLIMEEVNQNEILTNDNLVNVEYSSEYQDGFMVNSLVASRIGDKIIFTLDYYSNRDCEYSFFNPPNGDVIMKAVCGGIKTGSHTTELELSLYDLKRIMADQTITMKFGFDDQRSWINFRTVQFSSLADLGELENLPEEVVPTSITLNKSSLNLMVGKTEQLISELKPSEVTDSTVTWRSSDSSIATVDANGNVKGVSAGTATIIATTSNNLIAQCSVEINKIFDGNVEYLSEYQDGFMVNSLVASRNGDKIIFTLDYYSNRDCDYSFFNPPNGDVIMKAVYGGIKTGSHTTDLELSLYDFKRIMANQTITMKFGFDDKPNWIYFKTGQFSSLAVLGELENLPEEVVPNSITLSKSSLNLIVGNTEQLISVLEPSEVTDETVTWRSSDPSIATVDANGNVKGVSTGTATIIATTSNNLYVYCNIKVSAFLLGDVDSNSLVQAYDALMALQIAIGKKSGTPAELAASRCRCDRGSPGLRCTANSSVCHRKDYSILKKILFKRNLKQIFS